MYRQAQYIGKYAGRYRKGEVVMPMAMVGHPNLILEAMIPICKDKGWEFHSLPKKLHDWNEWNRIECKIRNKQFKAPFMLQQMPGCCAVLTASYIHPDPYSAENFINVVETIRKAAYEAGFGSLILTQVVRYPKYQKHVWYPLIERGYLMSEPFINAKSGNQVVYL